MKAIAVLKNLAEFTGRHQYRSRFLNKVAGLQCGFTKKETLAQMFSCELYEIFNNTFHRTPAGDCFCQSQKLKVKDLTLSLSKEVQLKICWQSWAHFIFKLQVLLFKMKMNQTKTSESSSCSFTTYRKNVSS